MHIILFLDRVKIIQWHFEMLRLLGNFSALNHADVAGGR